MDSYSTNFFRLLFIKDQATGTHYLVDTGSDLSVFPRGLVKKATCSPIGYQLYAANGSFIETYGLLTLKPDLGFRRNITWRFIVTDVTKPIIRADFLSHFDLVVDLKRKCLRDDKTNLPAKATRQITTSLDSVKAIHGNSDYIKLLREYKDITRPESSYTKIKKHSTMHHIRTTDGPSVKARARRLCPEKLKIAQDEFKKMTDLGICRPSDSPWSSPLHLVQKKSGE